MKNLFDGIVYRLYLSLLAIVFLITALISPKRAIYAMGEALREL